MAALSSVTEHVPPTPSQSESSAKLIVYVYKDQRKIGFLLDSYQSTVAICQKIFPSLLSKNFGFYTKELDICNGQLAEICADNWKDVVDQIKEVVIMDESPKTASQDGADSISATFQNPGTIFVENLSQGPHPTTRSYVVDLTSPIRHLKTQIEQKEGIPVDQQALTFGVRGLDDRQSFRHYHLCDGTKLLVTRIRRVALRKPVIYLLAPNLVEASVELSLVPQWRLSAIYPVAPIKSGPTGIGQCVSWRVRVHPEGHLTELSNGLDIAYLYWEALTNAPLPSSPPASPLLGPSMLELSDKVQAFDPTNVTLNDENAVVISVDEVTPYLDGALKALGLHIEARTSFITYWLPSFLNHKHVALRFLPQASYEQAAPLFISPTPDIVTRVFMVFKGVEESESWPVARKRVNENVSSWIDVVGVDVGRTVDKGLFRVIEWGGMEIAHH